MLAAAGAASCRPQKAEGFPGYAFVANSAGRAVAVVDLSAFAVTRHIRLEANPTEILSHPARPFVFALTPETGAIHEIDAESLTLSRSRRISPGAASMLLAPGGGSIWILEQERQELLQLSPDSLLVEHRLALPGRPVDFDLSYDGARVAVAFGPEGRVAIAETAENRITGPAALGGSADLLRFRSDGRQILVGSRSRRELAIVDAPSARLIVRLPLSVEPEHFCFKPDGGQLFITGRGRDAVVTVNPYETQIASTTLAGSSPGCMAAAADPDYLFAANPDAGDVTVLDINTQRVAAVVPAGRRPGHITVTPDNRYALVLNRDSGDMAVIRIETLSGRRRKLAPLFMMVPLGSQPVAAVVRTV